MSLKLSSTSVAPYSYFSENTGVNPITGTGTLTNSGGTVNITPPPCYLVATSKRYTNVVLTMQGTDNGIQWQLSLTNNGTDWTTSLNVEDMNALAVDVVKTIYTRAVVQNNGTVLTGAYTAPDIAVGFTEASV